MQPCGEPTASSAAGTRVRGPYRTCHGPASVTGVGNASLIDAAAPGRVLTDGLGPLIARLRQRGCTVVAPIAKDRVVALGEIESADELATGWVDVQEPGHYRAESTATGLFRHAAPAAPWKRWLHPEQRLVVRLRSDSARPDLDAPSTTVAPLAFVGIQSCDLAAIGRLDVVLANDDDYRRTT